MKFDGLSLQSTMLSKITQRRQVLYDITYMWNLKNISNEYNIKGSDSQIIHRQRINKWLPAVGSNTGIGEWEVQTTECKMGSRKCCTTWEIKPVFCNNCKWEVTF